MPKMKTKKAASKRFKVRSGGSIKRAHDEEQTSPARHVNHQRVG